MKAAPAPVKPPPAPVAPPKPIEKKKVAAVAFTPAPAVLQGPQVIRVEQPDYVSKPRPRPTGLSGTGLPAIVDEDEDADRGRSGPGGARRPGSGGPAAVPPKRRQSASPRRKGREQVPQIKEWSEQDMLARKEAILLADHRILGALTETKGGKPGIKKHSPTRAVSPLRLGHGKVEVEEPITVKSLSAATGVKVGDIIAKLMAQGVMANVNQAMSIESAELLCAGYNLELVVKRAPTMYEILTAEFQAREKGELAVRAPVVTILGHVDHGKTSLLDSIRKTKVAAGEAGGITQHIGAWKVKSPHGRDVVFIDTPGHTAFTAMRARGANMTDVVVLVVSPVDGGVMSTTIEAIDHAKAAEVPIVVALTKMDLPQVDENLVRKTLGQLAEKGLMPREWGGDVDVVRTSAVSGKGLDELLEHLAYTSELLELKADPEAPASGRVVEARMEPDRGKIATLLIQDGSMVVGDVVLCGSAYGRVRALFDDQRVGIEEAGPSTPVSIIGLDELPEAGDFFFVTDDVAAAKQAAEERRIVDRQKEIADARKRVTLGNWADSLKEGDVQELRIILRTDTQGSLDALTDSIMKVGSKEVVPKIIRSAVGGVSEADVELARASDAVIIGFHVVPEDAARKLAEHHGVEVRLYQVIYEIIDDVTRVLEGKLVPEKREDVLGHADIRQVFKVSKVGNVAGCFVVDGKILRNAKFRVIRGNVVIADGRELTSLRRFKEDVREVPTGMECGIKISGYDDIKEGDRLEAYQVTEVARKL
jgi:translation initiation factor IF-2